MKKTIITLLVVIIVAIGGYYIWKSLAGSGNNDQNQNPPVTDTTKATTTPTVQYKEQETIGTSVEGRDIIAYNYGTGTTRLLFVGGVHGGYEWNTVLESYALIDYLKANPSVIPSHVEVSVIPVVNPDGLYKVVGTTGRFTSSDVSSSQATLVSGRFNANNVDLNRNFDCNWQASGTWQNKTVSGGSQAFSEPESQAVKKYIETTKPAAVLIWYSAAGGIYTSSCNGSALPDTTTIENIYAKASGYPAHKNFDFYETTGDMADWLAANNIPAINVLLTNHSDIEWSKNQAGVEALLKHYAK